MTIKIIHLLKNKYFVYLHAIWPLTNVREPWTCKCDAYFKISGVLKGVIDYDLTFLTLVSV